MDIGPPAGSASFKTLTSTPVSGVEFVRIYVRSAAILVNVNSGCNVNASFNHANNSTYDIGKHFVDLIELYPRLLLQDLEHLACIYQGRSFLYMDIGIVVVHSSHCLKSAISGVELTLSCCCISRAAVRGSLRMLSTLSGIGLMSTHQSRALNELDVYNGNAYPFLVSLHPYLVSLASLATYY